MVQVFEFSDDIFGGCKIKMRVNDDESLSGICGECVKRVSNILENLQMAELVKIIRSKNWAISHPLEDILSSPEDTIFKIKCIQV